jgi:hypothetical protein
VSALEPGQDKVAHAGAEYTGALGRSERSCTDTKTKSNDINEIIDVLGIEAARQVLYDKILGVLYGC